MNGPHVRIPLLWLFLETTVDEIRKRGSDIPVILGGTVPDRDLPKLKDQGIAAVFTPGATADQIVEEVGAVLAAG